MNKEKKVLQTVLSAGEYLAPMVEVEEVRDEGVVCASPNETYNNGEDLDTYFG